MSGLDIEAMQAGRGLDRMVEERVFGPHAPTPAYLNKGLSAGRQLKKPLTEIGWQRVSVNTRLGPGVHVVVRPRYAEGRVFERRAKGFEEVLCKAVDQ